MHKQNLIIRVCLALVCGVLACTMLSGCALRKTLGKSCAMFVYMCGSDLETKESLGSANIDELLGAQIPEDTTVVIETGGSKEWHSHGIDASKIQRYEVKDKQLVLLDEQPLQSMGDPKTLTDFLVWGSKEYPAERNMLVLWDHGNKSANTLCFDENFGTDGLERHELIKAFKDAELPFTFDLLVFDMCYMSSIENAIAVKDFARYMIASQEVIPAYGCDYKFAAEEFAYMDDVEYSTAFCDAYIQKCINTGKSQIAELSVLDLSQTNNVIDALNELSGKLVSLQKTSTATKELSGAAKYSAIYGMKSIANLFDINNFLSAATYFDEEIDIDPVQDTCDAFVIHSVKGQQTENLGVSMYYPLTYNKKEIDTYVKNCPIENYGELLNSIYGHYPVLTVRLADAGRISDDGRFEVTLTPDSLNYLSSATYKLFQEVEPNSGEYRLLGTSCDVQNDPATVTYTSDFDGTWPSYGNRPLFTSIFQMVPHAVAYYSPVLVNGEEYNMLSVYKYGEEYKKGEYENTYIWTGFSKNGIPSRNFYHLDPGDVVTVLQAADESGDSTNKSSDYTVPSGLKEAEINTTKNSRLPNGRYRYQFMFTDIFGNSFASDYALLKIESNDVRLIEVQHT